MPGIIYADNDNYVWLKNFKFEENGDNINDAILKLSIGLVSSVKFITGASNATPILIDCAGHSLADNDKIVIVSTAGNKAANGPQTVANKTTNAFELAGSAGNGDLILPSSTLKYPRLYKTLPDLWGAAFSYVRPGTYKSLVQAAVNILIDEAYWVVATASNYGYQVQTGVTGKERLLGSFV